MKCLYCGKEMEQGYIKSPSQIFWSKDKDLGPQGESSVKLSGKFWHGFFNGFSVKSYYCPDCKKIITSIE